MNLQGFIPTFFSGKEETQEPICYVLQTGEPQVWIWKASSVEEHYYRKAASSPPLDNSFSLHYSPAYLINSVYLISPVYLTSQGCVFTCITARRL